MTRHVARLGLLAAAAIALSGVAGAQNLPTQFVVSGKAAEKIVDFTTINLATAQRIRPRRGRQRPRARAGRTALNAA